MYFTTRLFYKLKYSDEIKINESILIQGKATNFLNKKQWVIKIMIYGYFCLFSASKVFMSYGQLVTRFTTGGHDIFITCPGLSVHTFCGTGDENIIPPVVQRVITTYCQVWYSELAPLNKLDTFKAVNKLFNFEKTWLLPHYLMATSLFLENAIGY